MGLSDLKCFEDSSVGGRCDETDSGAHVDAAGPVGYLRAVEPKVRAALSVDLDRAKPDVRVEVDHDPRQAITCDEAGHGTIFAIGNSMMSVAP